MGWATGHEECENVLWRCLNGIPSLRCNVGNFFVSFVRQRNLARKVSVLADLATGVAISSWLNAYKWLMLGKGSMR